MVSFIDGRGGGTIARAMLFSMVSSSRITSAGIGAGRGVPELAVSFSAPIHTPTCGGYLPSPLFSDVKTRFNFLSIVVVGDDVLLKCARLQLELLLPAKCRALALNLTFFSRWLMCGCKVLVGVSAGSQGEDDDGDGYEHCLFIAREVRGYASRTTRIAVELEAGWGFCRASG